MTTEGMGGMPLTANIHPGSGMQDTANKVVKQISNVNRKNVKDLRTKLQEKIRCMDFQQTQ